MTQDKDACKAAHTTLEQMVANTCFCKLRTSCSDKNSSECMQHTNIYAEFMLQKHESSNR
jgi:hypothetical protein